jgi:predicted Zn-dependent protease
LQAIEEFKTTLKLDPAMKLGHYHLGFAYFSLGRNDEAIGEYKEELRRSGESPVVVDALGHALLASGKYAAAVTYLRRGTELDEPNPDVWYDLGKALALGEQWAQAEPALRRAAELNPKDPSPHYQLARVLEKLAQTDEARKERERNRPRREWPPDAISESDSAHEKTAGCGRGGLPAGGLVDGTESDDSERRVDSVGNCADGAETSCTGNQKSGRQARSLRAKAGRRENFRCQPTVVR